MDISAPAPRVNCSMLGQMIGKRVTVVGRFESLSGNTLRIKSADDGMVEVFLSGAAPQAEVVEVQGTVVNPSTVQADSAVGFSSGFDMANYNELVKLANGDYRSMFV